MGIEMNRSTINYNDYIPNSLYAFNKKKRAANDSKLSISHSMTNLNFHTSSNSRQFFDGPYRSTSKNSTLDASQNDAIALGRKRNSSSIFDNRDQVFNYARSSKVASRSNRPSVFLNPFGQNASVQGANSLLHPYSSSPLHNTSTASNPVPAVPQTPLKILNTN